MQAVTTSALGGSIPKLRKYQGHISKFHATCTLKNPLYKRDSFWRNNHVKCKRGDLCVKATWNFFGGQNGNNTKASIEKSDAANEDILLFFFQTDLETRVQYALNTEQYDIAKQLRDKLNEVERDIINQQQAKRGSSKSEAQDNEIKVLQLRTEMQKAIENEKYDLAAKLRDKVSQIEGDSLVSAAKALANENVKYEFRLGQNVKHKVFGYRGVICGMDPVCVESKSWMDNAKIDKLSKGPNQPFYQILVDVYVEPNFLVAYVAEENLLDFEGQYKGRFDHPYTSFLFYGTDTAGDFIPIRHLREKFNRPRHEPPFEQDEDDDTDT